MSRLQENAKPILEVLIEDNWCHISEFEQKILAAWAAMFVSVYEMADPPTAVIPVHHRGFLMDRSLVPPDWTVLIGRHDPEGHHPAYANHCGIKMSVDVEGLPKIVDIQFTGFTVGRLFIQTAMITPGNAIAGLSINHSEFSAHYDLRTIAPSQGPITDKPRVAHGRISRDEIANDGAQCFGLTTYSLNHRADI